MTNEQLELTLESARREARRNGPKSGARTPKYWFDQMRAAVDRAIDWGSLDGAPPRQTLLEFRPSRGGRSGSWGRAA